MTRPPAGSLGPIPWELIIERGPGLVQAAQSLLTTFARQSGAGAAADLPALRERLAQLEERQQAHAALVTQLTDQLNAVTVAAEASAARARHAFILSIVAIALAAVCAVALLMH